MNIKTSVEGNGLRIHYDSQYASGSCPVNSIADLIRVIEEICGKGSYVLYENKGSDYPKPVDYFKSSDLVFPTITFWQQGIKTFVIEQARAQARKVWGDIPELRIGWLENQMKSYIEDIAV